MTMLPEEAVVLIESRDGIPQHQDWGLMAAATVLAKHYRKHIIDDLRKSQAEMKAIIEKEAQCQKNG